MGPIKTGFELVAKRDRLTQQADQPTQVPMRPERSGQQRRNPSTDQKRIRQQMKRKTAASDEQLSRARQQAQQAGSASVSRVSGTDMLAICDAAGNDSDETVKWVRSQAEQAGQHSVSRVSGADLLKVCDMAEHGNLANNVPPGGWDDGPSYGHEDNDGKHPGDSASDESPYYAALQSRGSTMSVESDLLAAMATAPFAERQRLAGQLNRLRAEKTAAAQRSMEVDYAAKFVAAVGPMGVTAGSTMSKVQVTSESDWLGGAVPDESDPTEIMNEVTAEASLWFDNLHEAVKEDTAEFEAQAQGYAFQVAGRFGTQHSIAMDAFLRTASRLRVLADNPDVPPPSAYDHTNDEGSSLPLAVDNDATFDSDVTATAPAQGYHPTSPSLAEGSTPAGSVSESSENPIGAGDTTYNKATVPPLNDYIDGASSPWSTTSSVEDPRYPGLMHIASKRPVADEWGFLKTAEDQDTSDVLGEAPSLAEGTTPAGDVSEAPLQDFPAPGVSVNDGGNSTYVDPLNGNTTSPEGVVSASIRPLSVLARAIDQGEASRGRQIAPEARRFLAALSTLANADESYAGISGRDMVRYLNATVGTLTAPQSRQAHAEMQLHLAPRRAGDHSLYGPGFAAPAGGHTCPDCNQPAGAKHDPTVVHKPSSGYVVPNQNDPAQQAAQSHQGARTAAGPVPPQFQKGNDSTSAPAASSSDSSSSDSSSDDDPACKRSGCGHPKSKHSGGTGQCSECSCPTFQATADADSKDSDSGSSSSAPSGSGDSKPPWLTNKTTSQFRQRVQANLSREATYDPNCAKCRYGNMGPHESHTDPVADVAGAPHPGFAHAPGMS